MVALDMTQPTTSHHLNILENAGFLKSKREGKWMFYGLTNPDILKIINKLKSLV
jgi:ArsR family transcriptional regulator